MAAVCSQLSARDWGARPCLGVIVPLGRTCISPELSLLSSVFRPSSAGMCLTHVRKRDSVPYFQTYASEPLNLRLHPDLRSSEQRQGASSPPFGLGKPVHPGSERSLFGSACHRPAAWVACPRPTAWAVLSHFPGTGPPAATVLLSRGFLRPCVRTTSRWVSCCDSGAGQMRCPISHHFQPAT